MDNLKETTRNIVLENSYFLGGGGGGEFKELKKKNLQRE